MKPLPDHYPDRPEAIDHGRRAWLLASLATGGALVIGMAPEPANGAGSASAFAPNAFLRIARDGKVTLFMPYAEMGQGAMMSQAMIVAEELDLDPQRIVLEAAPADDTLYANPLLGAQISGGSASLRGSWRSMRGAAAAARAMLVQAAAQRWGVAVADCRTAGGAVQHPGSGRRLAYGELVDAASRLPVPAEPPLKQADDYKLVGKSLRRLDAPAKVNGSARYGIDVRLPGMLYAAVAACPVFGGRLGRVDDARALQVRGVRQVLRLPDAVAVVANSTWSAFQGVQALDIAWEGGADATLDSAALVARADAALEEAGLPHLRSGDVAAAERSAARVHESVFRLPSLAHAAIEPLNCTVHLREGRCDVWCGSQILGRAHKAAAEAAGLPLERVRMHNQLLGGGFGRRLEVDYVAQAVAIGRQVAAPVKVTWNRAEDFQHDYYRAHNHSRVRVALDAQGRPLSWHHRIVGPNIMQRWLPSFQRNGVDLSVVHGASGPYDIPNLFIEFTRHEPPPGMNVGNWRGVGPTRNVFIVETVMDELAARAGQDPVAYRLALMRGAQPRIRHVLELAAARSGWGSPLPPRSGRGVAVYEGFGSYAAIVAQVKLAPGGEIAVERVTCAVDVGLAVNPDIVRSQIEGGVVFGVSAALLERVIVQGGRVAQANFDTYPVLRMHAAPVVEVHIVENRENPGGAGELSTPGTIAAVANAVGAASGVRAYSLPLEPARFRAA
ncbi:hypothetical protein B0920_04660 [Massilia sp. KIM]|uniref:xanthine dehydrogenase family protein molybdopterin-binding subunit n=1 Tax=Massilia sp. KIM TaxID=1955422 RepID=UPI00098F394A|nr:molybdopterin cofactor-binding domain-containing protein [Massilia sp. KIM]OON62732.1 hypothetical protein B0920_04660 [Massilia sp. KIM]